MADSVAGVIYNSNSNYYNYKQLLVQWGLEEYGDAFIGKNYT